MTTLSPIERGELATSIIEKASFFPSEPRTIDEIGLSEGWIESLILKYLLGVYDATGRQIARVIGLPFSLVDKQIASLRTRRLIVSKDVATFGDFTIQLTEEGHQQALRMMQSCSYVGTAPVTLEDYLDAMNQQKIRRDLVDKRAIEKSFESISMVPALKKRLGPAIRSGAGLFLYGSPGNGKTTIAERIGRCFEQNLWIPNAIVVDNVVIKLYDPSYHEAVEVNKEQGFLKQDSHDGRWILVKRPTVVAGGELTLEALDVQHNMLANISEAPLQMKANGGVLVIDDFGRQRVSPADLLNRWIVPLDRNIDLLTLHTGKRIEVPFHAMVIFSTNLEPKDLVDEAFLRRIPYKIHVPDPDDAEFARLMQNVAATMNVRFNADALEHLISKHYRDADRPKRRCHPRDLLRQLVDRCDYLEIPSAMTPSILDEVAHDYFLHGPMMTI
ncbi:AAA family ATPase [bacterium]|nr:AAA family ATPase [bacterium]